MRFIESALHRSDGPRGVVLAGAAGVGKTRLAREAVAVAARRGAAVRWAVGSESARVVPLGAFPMLGGAVSGDPGSLLRDAADRLLADAGPAGVVVGVDDAHLLDELSSLLVYQLTMRKDASVVVTTRTGEPAPDVVSMLWKDGYLSRLELQPLSRAETGTLLEAVLGGPIEGYAADRLWALSQGNALFLRQLVDVEAESGRLRRAGSVWQWSGSPVLSPTLADLIEARIGALPDRLQEVVDLLAVCEPLGASLLGGLTSSEAVEDAERRGLVSVIADGRRCQVRLAHPLYGEARRSAIGTLRGRRLRRAVATAIAATGARRSEDILRRATLMVASDLEPDPVLLGAAAQTALRLMDMGLAEQLARAAVAAGGGVAARLVVANALTFLGRGEEAEQELAELTALVETDIERAIVGTMRVGNMFWTLRRTDEAERLVAEVEATITDDVARQSPRALRTGMNYWLGRPAQAVATAGAVLATPSLPDWAVVVASVGLTAGLGELGRADEMDPAARRGYAAANRSIETSFLRLDVTLVHLRGLALAGYLDEAEDLAHAQFEEISALPKQRPYGVALKGLAALYAGRLEMSRRLLREAIARLPAPDTLGYDTCCLLALAQAQAMAGEADFARQTLAALGTDRHRALRVLEPELLLARAWATACEGSTREAVDLCRDAAALAAEREELAQEVVARQTAVRFGDRAQADRLAELARLVDGPRAAAAHAHAVALAANDGAALAAASARFAEFGDIAVAADAAAHATAVLADHDQRAATAAAIRMKDLTDRAEGLDTPAVRTAVQPVSLTEREREIASLAAQGLTNREIADRLVVSVRTVEGHLYRASAKLGCTKRSDLASALH